jgi:hypothetical protein
MLNFLVVYQFSMTGSLGTSMLMLFSVSPSAQPLFFFVVKLD